MFNISHILIGCPSSGKSTVADELIKLDPNYRIVSTDKIRKELFGDESIQGDWELIEAEVLSQIKDYIEAGIPIIYDATNAKRHWRMEFLQKLQQYNNIQWIGWHLKTPLEVCQQWNKNRKRQVQDTVIEELSHSLKQFPPIVAEGFTAVYEISYAQGKLDLNQLSTKITSLSRNIINRKNRTQNQNIKLHSYSCLLDFDRLMHLISLLIHYPGAGNLQTSDPQQLKRILGENIHFETALDEICVLLAKHADSFYANQEAIAKDLNWLESNGIISPTVNHAEIQIKEIDLPNLVTHPYSDIEPFERLIKTIHCILHHPLLHYPEQRILDTLIQEMQAQNVINFNCADSVRKDIGKVLKPFRILPNFTMKRGYFLGTAILAEPDLVKIFQLLERQVKSLEDPVALEVYQRFRERMKDAQIAKSNVYPTRAIYNRTIVDIDTLPNSALARRIEEVEMKIEEGKLLELGRLQGVSRYSEETDDFCLAFPLQIVFHNIGWYLGYECTNGHQINLFQFERLDRLFLGKEQTQNRTRIEQEKALSKLQTLYQCSGGIYLGNNFDEQRCYLSRDKAEKAKVEVTLELWFNDTIFRFVSEGTKRFPTNQIKMSSRLGRDDQKFPFTLKKTGNPNFPNRFQVTLPKWSLEDVDLLRWIVGFGGQVKVVQPLELIEKVKSLGEAIQRVYQPD